jgi:hypothetical protein
MAVKEQERYLPPCPFCGTERPTVGRRTATETQGYKISIAIACSSPDCGANISAESIMDQMGWCSEHWAAVLERAILKWERRP